MTIAENVDLARAVASEQNRIFAELSDSVSFGAKLSNMVAERRHLAVAAQISALDDGDADFFAVHRKALSDQHRIEMDSLRTREEEISVLQGSINALRIDALSTREEEISVLQDSINALRIDDLSTNEEEIDILQDKINAHRHDALSDLSDELQEEEEALGIELTVIRQQRLSDQAEFENDVRALNKREVASVEDKARKIKAFEEEIADVYAAIAAASAGRTNDPMDDIDAARQAALTAEERRFERGRLEMIAFNANAALMEEALEVHRERMASINADFDEDEDQVRTDRNNAWQDASLDALGAIADYTNAAMETWKSTRMAQLREMGLSQEEANKVIEKEGAKRFKMVKALALAEAIANGISAVVGAYKSGASVGGPILGAIMAATAALAVGTQIQQIRRLTLTNPTYSNTTGGGGVSAAGFTVLNDAITADRVGDFEASSAAGTSQGSNADFVRAVERFEAAASNLRIGDDAAEEAYERGRERAEAFNN